MAVRFRRACQLVLSFLPAALRCTTFAGASRDKIELGVSLGRQHAVLVSFYAIRVRDV